jgi:hypothetical protein
MRSRAPSSSVLAYVVPASLLALASVACGGAAQNEPIAAPKPTPSTSASQTTAAPKPPPEIPVVAPQVAATPSMCADLVGPKPEPKAEAKVEADPKAKDAKADPKAPKKDAKGPKPTGPCADGKAVLATLAAAARAEASHDRAARDAALASLATCERFPTLVGETLRAEVSPMVCAEAIVTPALDARGKEALPQHQAAARGLIGASRLARLRPKAGEFDLLARAEKDPAAAEAGKKLLLLWKDALEKEESDAIALSKGAPAEIVSVVRFEIAAAWLAFAKEIRATPLPEEIKALGKKDPDLEVRYLAKLDEVTMPIVDRAKQIALAGLGAAIRDGILVKSLPSYQAVHEAFRSRVGFEVRATRELDLQLPEPLAGKPSDAVVIAATLPPWVTYAALERAEPAALLGAPVLEAMAATRGIPSALRLEVERDKNLDDPRKGAIALSRTRVALEYESVPDAQAVAGWAAPKRPIDQLRVGVAKALLGPQAPTPKPGDPIATAPQSAYELKHLDALAKGQGAIALAADDDAALLALDGAQRFAQAETAGGADPKLAYEAAIKRLDAFEKRKGADPKKAARAKELATSARETLKLLQKPVPASVPNQPKTP